MWRIRILMVGLIALATACGAGNGEVTPVAAQGEATSTTAVEVTKQQVCERWWDISEQFGDGTSSVVVRTRLGSLAELAEQMPSRDGSPNSYFVDRVVELTDVLASESDDPGRLDPDRSQRITDLVLEVGFDCDAWRP